MIVLHRPELNCRLNGDTTLFDKVPRDKSLLKGNGTRGLAIGNLTSQIFANFFMDALDKHITSFPVGYGRYVDDFVIIGKKDVLLQILSTLRTWLKTNLDVTLHPDKIYLQSVSKGVSFIGGVIKPGRTYISNRTVGSLIHLIDIFNNLSNKEKQERLWKFCQSFNSYFGFIRQHSSYNIKKELWDRLNDNSKKFFYLENRNVLKIRNKYKNKLSRYLIIFIWQ